MYDKFEQALHLYSHLKIQSPLPESVSFGYLKGVFTALHFEVLRSEAPQI